jgi:hypothetical protein
MTDKHIIQILVVVFPERKTKNTILDVKVGGRVITVLDVDVLFGQETCQK